MSSLRWPFHVLAGIFAIFAATLVCPETKQDRTAMAVVPEEDIASDDPREEWERYVNMDLVMPRVMEQFHARKLR